MQEHISGKTVPSAMLKGTSYDLKQGSGKNNTASMNWLLLAVFWQGAIRRK